MSETRRAPRVWEDVIDARTLRRYASFERPRRLLPAPALLMVDFYHGQFAGGSRPIDELLQDHPSSCGEVAWAALRPALALLDAFRRAERPVVFSTGRVGRQAAATMRDRRGRTGAFYALLPELEPREDEIVIVKDRASAFYGTPLVAELTLRGVRSVVLCGGTTSGCVRASAVDAYSNGFATALAEDACFDRSPLSHKVNLFDLHMKYADVVPALEIEPEPSGMSAI